jgi:penicillin-binding protein 2
MQENKRWVIQAIFVITALIFISRLFYLQIIDNSFKDAANGNAIRRHVLYPHRGQIYDRYGKLLVYNIPVYDLTITLKEVPKNLDTLALCRTLNITPTEFLTLIAEMKTERGFSTRKPCVFLKQLSQIEFAKIQDKLVDFPGFGFVPRTVRAYPHHSLANMLGYIGEISKSRLESQKDNYYQPGDYIGISGLESFYESQLRGRRGVKYTLVDVHGVEKGAFKNGEWDSLSVAGENLISSIDLELQQFCENLLQNKPGTIVAIEPETGEILAMVSYPTYDPNRLSGRQFSKNFTQLTRDPLKPLFNRALMSAYPPGSFFKIVQAAIGLQEGVITPETAFMVGTSPMKDHVPAGVHNDLHAAIQWSSNTYFYHTFRRIILKDGNGNPFEDAAKGYANWREKVLTFGIGDRLGIDLPNEQKGILKKNAYFDKVYGPSRWKFSNLYSMSIGQGELGVVPVQMANLAAIVANRGWYYTPHLIKSVGKSGKPLAAYQEKHKTFADSKHFATIVEGMQDAVERGTVWKGALIDSITFCGKTSTVQNPQGKDHSAFIGFAPKNNPKIAVAVFLENAGWGGSEAAPIASLVIEKHLKKQIQRKNLEKWYREKNFLPDWATPYRYDTLQKSDVIIRQVSQ